MKAVFLYVLLVFVFTASYSSFLTTLLSPKPFTTSGFFYPGFYKWNGSGFTVYGNTSMVVLSGAQLFVVNSSSFMNTATLYPGYYTVQVYDQSYFDRVSRIYFASLALSLFLAVFTVELIVRLLGKLAERF